METWKGLLVKVVRVRVESEWLVVGACTKTNTGLTLGHAQHNCTTFFDWLAIQLTHLCTVTSLTG